jgi:glycosyltransferase involved in cell wall biosynthesis
MKKYVIITPARDEESHIQKTILAVASQSVLPAQWIIVNDGSSDGTAAIIDGAAKSYPWITSLHRSDRGFRQAGGGVIATFNAGYSRLNVPDWDFIVKLDADLNFSPDYFERCFDEFDTDPRLGIGGGGIYHDTPTGLELEQNPAFHVRGATKIYRRQCWDQLGGLLEAPGWDTIDEVRANMLGWSTRTFPKLQVSHSRFTGAADGAWKDSVKNGFANYVTGYHPAFMLVKCLRRLVAKPYFIGSVGLAWGFIKGYFRRGQQAQDPAFISYVRSQQMRRLFCQETIWK